MNINLILIFQGKINSVIMDSCRKTAVVFDSLVSSMEIVNCQSCQMQVSYFMSNKYKMFSRKLIITNMFGHVWYG